MALGEFDALQGTFWPSTGELGHLNLKSCRYSRFYLSQSENEASTDHRRTSNGGQ